MQKTYEIIAILRDVDDPRKPHIDYDSSNRTATFPVRTDMRIVPLHMKRRDIVGPDKERLEIAAASLAIRLATRGYEFEVREASHLPDGDRRLLIALRRERDKAVKEAGVLASCVSYTPPHESGPVAAPAKIRVRWPTVMFPGECLSLGKLIVATSRLAVTEQLFFDQRER